MSEKKLIAIDLDGTTLHSDGVTISDFTKDIFKAVQKKGHTITIATGRPYRMALDIYHELALESPMINFNGGLISHPRIEKWPYFKQAHIKKDIVFDLLKQQQALKLDFLATEYRKNFFINDFQAVTPELFGVAAFEPKHRLILDKVTKNPTAMLIQTQLDKFKIAKDLDDKYQGHISVSAWGGPNGILEIVPKGISKAYGLKHLLNILKMGREQLIAFGDEHNDIEMLTFAGTGYAMKNASERLLPHADSLLPWTNDEDGVAKKLADLLL